MCLTDRVIRPLACDGWLMNPFVMLESWSRMRYTRRFVMSCVSCVRFHSMRLACAVALLVCVHSVHGLGAWFVRVIVRIQCIGPVVVFRIRLLVTCAHF